MLIIQGENSTSVFPITYRINTSPHHTTLPGKSSISTLASWEKAYRVKTKISNHAMHDSSEKNGNGKYDEGSRIKFPSWSILSEWKEKLFGRCENDDMECETVSFNFLKFSKLI